MSETGLRAAMLRAVERLDAVCVREGYGWEDIEDVIAAREELVDALGLVYNDATSRHELVPVASQGSA